MRPKGTPAALQASRLRAADLLAAEKPEAVAIQIGADHSSVKKWKAAMDKGGREALAAKSVPPRTCKLALEQKQ